MEGLLFCVRLILKMLTIFAHRSKPVDRGLLFCVKLILKMLTISAHKIKPVDRRTKRVCKICESNLI
jgi:hypothetical protein